MASPASPLISIRGKHVQKALVPTKDKKGQNHIAAAKTEWERKKTRREVRRQQYNG